MHQPIRIQLSDYIHQLTNQSWYELTNQSWYKLTNEIRYEYLMENIFKFTVLFPIRIL